MKLDYVLDKKVVIFGTGIDGIRCMDILSKQHNISPEYFLINNCQQENLGDFLVLECDKNNVAGKFVLVATRELTYTTIKKQFCEMGLVEFEDFIYYEWMFKQLVLLHGNCHLDIIESYLRSSKIFLNQYSIYPVQRICMNNEKKISVEVLHNIDLWIHEDIQEKNSYSYYLSDNYLRCKMSESVKEIIIPHLFGLGKLLFPYSNGNKRNPWLSNNKDKNGMFPHADFLIDKCVEKGFSVKQIVDFCLDENAMSEKEVLNNFEFYMDKIRLREEKWDIKVLDFIFANYRKQKLFYDMGHPTNILLEYITLQILKELDISEAISTDMQLDHHEVPVYPTVRKHLQLEWKEEKIRKSAWAKRIAPEMDIEEYVREYLFWCYQI